MSKLRELTYKVVIRRVERDQLEIELRGPDRWDQGTPRMQGGEVVPLLNALKATLADDVEARLS